MSEPNLDRWAREVVEQSKGSVRAGLVLTLALHVLGQVVMCLIVLAIETRDEYMAILPVVYLGLSQLVYMIPAILVFRRRGDTETAKGLIIGASVTFLLSAACNGLMFFNR